MHRTDYDDWVFLTKTMIAAASIAIQCRDHTKAGRGGVTEEMMALFDKEAQTLAEVWLNVLRRGES